MHLKSLQLHQFKNHTDTELIFNKNVSCFVGNNGAGKTNILDAIHYLSNTKSYFNHIDIQNIQFNHNYFMLKGVFSKEEKEIEIQCNVKDKAGKIISHNQKKYKRFSEHIGRFPIVIISPTDTNLILEGSETRRKYIDTSISLYEKPYLQLLINYNKTLKQRNHLLKRFSENGYFDQLSLDIYNDQLIDSGEAIYKKRCDFIKNLNPVFNRYYTQISSSQETVNLKLRSQLEEYSLAELLKESLIKDRASNYTQCGIHKDDIIFHMNDKSIKKIGSQGQQKSFLIALKLAQFEFIEKQLGFKPILLLDDIFDKLDENRVIQLINLINKNVFNQVFITDTQKIRCENILNKANIEYNLYVIDNGNITNE